MIKLCAFNYEIWIIRIFITTDIQYVYFPCSFQQLPLYLAKLKYQRISIRPWNFHLFHTRLPEIDYIWLENFQGHNKFSYSLNAFMESLFNGFQRLTKLLIRVHSHWIICMWIKIEKITIVAFIFDFILFHSISEVVCFIFMFVFDCLIFYSNKFILLKEINISAKF